MSVLNQIVRADAEKIDVTSERSRTNRRALGISIITPICISVLNGMPAEANSLLHSSTISRARRSSVFPEIIGNISLTLPSSLARKNRPQLRFEDLRMFEAKPNGAQPQKGLSSVAHVDPAGDLVATEIEGSNNQWVRPDRFGDAPISLVLLLLAGQ